MGRVIAIIVLCLSFFGCHESIDEKENKGESINKETVQIEIQEPKASNFSDTSFKNLLTDYYIYVDSKIDIAPSSLLFNVVFSKENNDTIISFDASKYKLETIDTILTITSVFKEDSMLFVIWDNTLPLGSKFYKIKEGSELLKPYELSAEGDLVHDLSPRLSWYFRIKNNQLIKEE